MACVALGQDNNLNFAGVQPGLAVHHLVLSLDSEQAVNPLLVPAVIVISILVTAISIPPRVVLLPWASFSFYLGGVVQHPVVDVIIPPSVVLPEIVHSGAEAGGGWSPGLGLRRARDYNLSPVWHSRPSGTTLLVSSA